MVCWVDHTSQVVIIMCWVSNTCWAVHDLWLVIRCWVVPPCWLVTRRVDPSSFAESWKLSSASLPSRHPAGPVTLRRRPIPWCRVVRSWVPRPSKTGHAVSPSWFVDRQRTTFHTSRNKRRFMSNVTWKNAHSCDRLTSEVSSHKPTSFLASKNAWERPLGQIHIRTWARRKSKWTTGGCSALRRCGCATERKGDSISLFQISPGIGWRVDCMQPLLRRS